MGDQAVVDRRGGQHAHQIKGHGPEGGGQAQTSGQQQQAAEMGGGDEHGPEAVQGAASHSTELCRQSDVSQICSRIGHLIVEPHPSRMPLELNAEQWQSLAMLGLAVVPIALLWWAWLRLLP